MLTFYASDQPSITSSASNQPSIPSRAKRPLFASSSSAFTSSKRSFFLRSGRSQAVLNSHSNQSSNKHYSSDNEDDLELSSSYERLTPIKEERSRTHHIEEHRTLSRASLLNIHGVRSEWTPSNATLRPSDCANGSSDEGSHSRPSFYTGSSYSLEDRIKSTSPEFFSIMQDNDNGSWTHGFSHDNSPLREDSELDEDRSMTPCSQLSLSFSRFDMK